MPISAWHAAADDHPESLSSAVERADALWRGDTRGRMPTTLVPGPKTVNAVWQWQHPPDDDHITRLGERRVDPGDITRLSRARGHYQEMYRRVGGVAVRSRIAALLTAQAGPLLRATYDNQLGRQLFRTVGGLAALAGICAYDANQQPLAQRYLLTALRLAKASGDRAFGAYIVALLANQALYLEHCRLVVQYTQAALRAGGANLGPALTCDLHALAGKAYARMGDGIASRKHLTISETAAGRLAGDHGPDEVSYVQPGLIETQLAEALRRLHDLTAARGYAEESVRTAADTHLRGQVHRHAGLALILAAQGDLDRSVHTANQMLNLAAGMESGRIHDRIHQVTHALRPHHTEPAVAELLDRANDHLQWKGP